MRPTALSLLASSLLVAQHASAAVTVYTAQTALPPMPTFYYNAFSDETVLNPPGVPGNLNKQVNIQLYTGGMNGMSLPVVRPTPPWRRPVTLTLLVAWLLPWLFHRIVHRHYPL